MGMNYAEALTVSFLDELEKIGTAKVVDLSKAEGLKRVGELLSGSRRDKLVASLTKNLDRNNRIVPAAFKRMDNTQKGMDRGARAVGRSSAHIVSLARRTGDEKLKVLGTRAAAVGAPLGAGVAALKHKKNKEQEKVALLDVGIAGLMGSSSAPEGHKSEGALRGAGGYLGGALVGGNLGANIGRTPQAAVLGHIGGGIGGYYVLKRSREDYAAEDRSKKKQAAFSMSEKLKRLQERRDPDGIERKEGAARPK